MPVRFTRIRSVRAITIECPFEIAAAYLADPLNYSAWAIEYFSGPVRELSDGSYRVETTDGEKLFSVAADAEHGHFDLCLAAPGESDADPTPLRLVPNGEGVDLLFPLTRELELSEADWTWSLEALERELAVLKRTLEAQPVGRTNPQAGPAVTSRK